jgi:ankyrin repeat protein
MESIHKAIENGDVALVERLLRITPLCRDSLSSGGDTPLHVAVHNNNRKIATILLDAGANINAIGEYENTPFHYAAKEGLLDMAKLLLDHGADVERKNRLGYTALLQAAYGSSPDSRDVANELIGRGTYLDLNSAARLGIIAHVREILKMNSVAIQDALFPKDLLEDAIQSNCPEIVELLLQAGIDPNEVGSAQRPPIFSAVEMALYTGQMDTLRHLLNRGVRTDVRGYYGQSLFDRIEEYGERAPEKASIEERKAAILHLLRHNPSHPFQDP